LPPYAAHAGQEHGNSLDVLDRRFARGNVLEYLADLTGFDGVQR